MLSHVQTKNLPEIVKAIDQRPMSPEYPWTRIEKNLTDLRQPNGLVNWTEDQEKIIMEYL